MIKHYLKIAYRGFLKYKVQNLISILGVAIGAVAFVLGGYWYYWEYSFDTFHSDYKRTFALTTVGLGQSVAGEESEIHQIHRDVEAKILAFPEIESCCRTNIESYYILNVGSGPVLLVDTMFFSFFDCEFIEGTYKGIPYNRESIILTERIAQKYLGTVSCVNEIFKVDDHEYKVAGVIKDFPSNTSIQFDFLLLGEPYYFRHWNRAVTYVKLHEKADIKSLKEKVASLRFDGEDPAYEKEKLENWRFRLRSLPELHLKCSIGLESRFKSIFLLALAGLLAFISALMSHLVLFMGQQQKKKTASFTFTTLGASKNSLLLKNLIEIFLPILSAIILAFIFLEILFPFYQEYTQLRGSSGSVFVNYVQTLSFKHVLWNAFILLSVSLLVFGLMAFLLILLILKNKKAFFTVFIRRVLITGQIFIGSFFFFTSLVFYKQYLYMNYADKGIVTHNIYQINLGFYATAGIDCTGFKETLLRHPLIEDITTVYYTPVLVENGMINMIYSFNHHNNEQTTVNLIVVEEDFLSFFGLQMLDGDWLESGRTGIVMNETAFRELGYTDFPDGGFRWNEREEEEFNYVIGVMKDYFHAPLIYPIDKLFFILPNEEHLLNLSQYFYIKIKPESDKKVVDFIKSIYHNYDRGEIPEENQVLNLFEVIYDFSKAERTLFYIFSFLSCICILIASFGIYSLVSLSVEQRKKEIAIRKVNGAQFKDIFYNFFKEYLFLVLVGNLLSFPLGVYVVQKWLEAYSYRVSIDIWLFGLVIVITILIVFLSVVSKIYKTVSNNPADALKGE